LFQIFSYVQWLRPLSSSCNYSEPIRKTTKTTVSQVSTSNILPPAPFSFFFLQVIFRCGGFGYFPGAAPVIFRGGLFFSCGSGYFPRRLWLFFRGGLFFPAALVIFPRRLWLFSRRGNSNYTVLDIFLPL
jgi:hypothetical protein